MLTQTMESVSRKEREGRENVEEKGENADCKRLPPRDN